MTAPGTGLLLVVVSEDWFARSLLESLAIETQAFAKVIAVDDGYSALVETWQGVVDGAMPNVYLIDQHSVGPSAGRLITELRSDPTTLHVYIAVLTPAEPVARGGIDLASPCTPSQPEAADVIRMVATRARVSLQAGRAA